MPRGRNSTRIACEVALAVALLLCIAAPMVSALPRRGVATTVALPSTKSGRVHDHAGHGVPGVTVLAFAGSRASHARVVATAISDSQGAYELRGLPSRPVELWIDPSDAAGWIAPTKGEQPASSQADFRYDPVQTGSVSILTESPSGRVHGATLSLDNGARVGASVDGRYRFDGLAPGTHTLAAAAPGCRAETVSFSVAAGDLAVVHLAPDTE